MSTPPKAPKSPKEINWMCIDCMLERGFRPKESGQGSAYISRGKCSYCEKYSIVFNRNGLIAASEKPPVD